MAAIKLHFTKTALDALPTPQTRTYYRDTKEPKLGIYVTPKGVKTYFSIIRANGKTQRVPVGRFPDLSVPLARERAASTVSQTAETGISPVQIKREQKAASVTLQEVLDTYLVERDLKPSTVRDYRLAINESFDEYLNRPMADITEKVVRKCYQERGKSSKARADNAARVLRALFNFAKARYKTDKGRRLFPGNPTDILNEERLRYRISRRKSVIPQSKLPKWWEAVHALNTKEARDFLLFLILTGARRGEASGLKWSDISFADRTFHIANPKNRESVTLPLPSYIADILKKRAMDAGLVFPEAYDPRKSINAVRKASEVEFSPHDLRRTYITIAESLDISAFTIKALVNHKMTNDVTAGYISHSPERLAQASKRIENRILILTKTRKAKVLQLSA